MTSSTLFRVPTSVLTVPVSTAHSLASRASYLMPSDWCFINYQLGIIPIKMRQMQGVDLGAKSDEEFRGYQAKEQVFTYNEAVGVFLSK
jgi:hypothetical protein